MHGLGAALDSAGDHAAAAKRLERAVRGREKVLGAAHEDTAATAFDLGCALVTLGRISAAARHFLANRGVKPTLQDGTASL